MKKWEPVRALRRLVLWTLGALAATALLTGILGWLVLGEAVPYASAPMIAAILGALCLFGACYVAVKAAPDRRLLYALAMAGGYVGVGLLIRAALGAGAGFEADLRLVLPAAAAVAAGLLASRRTTRHRR